MTCTRTEFECSTYPAQILRANICICTCKELACCKAVLKYLNIKINTCVPILYLITNLLNTCTIFVI